MKVGAAPLDWGTSDHLTSLEALMWRADTHRAMRSTVMADRGDLRVRIGDTGHAQIRNRRRRLLEETASVGNILGNEDPVRETPVRKL